MKEIYTKNKLADMFDMKSTTVAKILEVTKTTADGKRGPNLAYTYDTFLEAKEKYYSSENQQDEILEFPEEKNLDEKIDEADLRLKLARIEELEIKNAKAKNEWVSRDSAERFVQYVVRLFAGSILDICRKHNEEELYNDIVSDLTHEIEGYIVEKGFDHIVSEEAQEKIRDIVEETPKKEDFSI